MNETPPEPQDELVSPEYMVAWRAVHDPEHRARVLARIPPEVHRTVLEVFRIGLRKVAEERASGGIEASPFHEADQAVEKEPRWEQ